jgi:pyrroline-5-carboxylate reductase
VQTHTITFIGCGNMARSLIGGLVADGWPRSGIRVADPNRKQREAIAEHFGVAAFDQNDQAVAGADVVLLAVKPNVVNEVIEGLSKTLGRARPLLLSIAAGIRVCDLQRWLGSDLPIVRTMPNTPALVRSGATGLFANTHTSGEQRDLAESIMRAVGVTVWVKDEVLLDAVTAVSGSGPAYFFMLMEALEAAGSEMGLSAESARLLAVQTAFGAAKLALESNEDPATLRRRVTSPGGTTEQAVRVLEAGQLADLVSRAARAAQNRSKELAKAFGAQK